MYDGRDRPRSQRDRRSTDDAALLREFAATEGWRGDMRAMRAFVDQVRADIGERGTIHRLGWTGEGAPMAWYTVDPDGAPAAAPSSRPAVRPTASGIPTTSDAAGRIPSSFGPAPTRDQEAETVAWATDSPS